jgi:acyl-homoserine-lactone acylase
MEFHTFTERIVKAFSTLSGGRRCKVWLQNTNDPPWTTTFPSPIAPDNYPAYMAPRGPMSLRSQRSAKMLLEDEKISFDELMPYKHSTQVELASRLLDDLIPAARQGSAQARRAAEVLATWDRKVDADSRGAVLFAFWKKAMDADRLFAKPWSEDAPRERRQTGWQILRRRCGYSKPQQPKLR